MNAGARSAAPTAARRARQIFARAGVLALSVACAGGGDGGGGGGGPVAPAPVASVQVTGSSSTLMIGATLQAAVATLDAGGTVLTGRAVEWSSSSSATASVSSSGLVTGVSLGTASIRATSEGKVGEMTVTVQPSTAPTIATISPAVLTSGAAATITGTNFSADATANAVVIDGVGATVTSATATQLVVTVPLLPCIAAHAGAVSVSVGGLAASVNQQVRAGTPLAIVTGTPVILPASAAGCAELPASGGQYLVSVVNTASSPTSTTGFRVSGSGAPGAVASLADAGARPSMQRVATPALLHEGGTRTADVMHSRILDASRSAFGRLRGTRLDRTSRASRASRARASASDASRSVSAAPLPAVGDLRAFRIAQFSTALGGTPNVCSNFKEISARVVYVGKRNVVYEDVAAPLAGQADTQLREIGVEFDDEMYGVDSTYFGDPLVTDADTDADGRLNMVFTPSITAGVAGFVISCDFFLRDELNNQVSNLGENFYAIVPTVAGAGFSGNTPDRWLSDMRRTIVHEVKHIASFGARLQNNASNFEESWLEEGLARHSEELWVRNHVYNVAWKGNTAYRQSLYCDRRQTFPECAGAPLAMLTHFSTLYQYLDNPSAYSVFGRVADGDFNFYASSWSFVRYALDQHAAAEAPFLRAITQAVNTRGMASLAVATGRDPNDVFTRWTLSLYADDLPATLPELAFPTWNTRDIYAGLNRDYSNFPKPFPLVPTPLGTASFSVDNAGVHSGSFGMYLLPGSPTTTRTIGLSRQGGGALAPENLRVAVLRLP